MMKDKKWLLIGLGGLAVWYFFLKNAAPESAGQTPVDSQTGAASGSGWDILGLLGSVSMD